MFGDYAWVRRTGGRLSRLDRLRLLAQGVRARAAARADGRRRHVLRHVDPDTLAPPDTPLVLAADDLLRSAAQPWLYEHSVRAWYWARLVDDTPESAFDAEALFVGFLLHDLGIVESHRLAPGEGEDFTLVGARTADVLCRKHGWPDRRAQLVADAITLHLNPVVDGRHSREARMLRAGAGADIAGSGLWRVHPSTKNAVLSRHPRLGFKNKVGEAMCIEMRSRPCCRISFLYEKLGFGRLVRAAPFED